MAATESGDAQERRNAELYDSIWQGGDVDDAFQMERETACAALTRHVPQSCGEGCGDCGAPWPCDAAVRAAQIIEAL